jgi:hypothetical protein
MAVPMLELEPEMTAVLLQSVGCCECDTGVGGGFVC